jgi:hypothetical protein
MVLQEKLDIQFQKIAASKLAAAEALNKKLELKSKKIPNSPSSEKKIDSEKGEITSLIECITCYIYLCFLLFMTVINDDSCFLCYYDLPSQN